MDRDEAPPAMAPIETERLLLRTWRLGDAAFRRALWAERDPRVPAHRRITHDGHPGLAEMETWLRGYEQIPAPGLLVVQRKGFEAALGYCGLIESTAGHPDEPELAYEFLRTSWNHGYATEAAGAIVNQARLHGYKHLVSTVRVWNTASLRVLEKLGFDSIHELEDDEAHGNSLLLRRTL